LDLPIARATKLRVTSTQPERTPFYLRTFSRVLSSWVHQHSDQRKHINVVYGWSKNIHVIRQRYASELRDDSRPSDNDFRALLRFDGQLPCRPNGTFALQPGIQEHRKGLNRDLPLRSRHRHEVGRQQSDRRKSWASASPRVLIVRGTRQPPPEGQSHGRALPPLRSIRSRTVTSSRSSGSP
jgi:hypothetical protein